MSGVTCGYCGSIYHVPMFNQPQLLPAPHFRPGTHERSELGGSVAQNPWGREKREALQGGAGCLCGQEGGTEVWGDVAFSHMKILVYSSYSGSLATLITNIRIFGDVWQDCCLFPNLICI